MTIKIQNIPVIYEDRTFRIADGSTAERPESPEAGMIRFNTTLQEFEGYDGDTWQPFYSNVIRTPVGVGTSPTTQDGVFTNVTFTLVASAYIDLLGVTHASSDWQISTDPSFATTEVDISEDTSNLESYEVDGGISTGDTYYWRVRYRDINGNVSEFSDAAEFEVLVLPDTFGQKFGGGIYMGAITAAGQCYALIVAPNATGCTSGCRWRTVACATAGTGSCVDGFANTYGPMTTGPASHPAGNWCATRNINGFSDWYLPAITEMTTFRNNGASSNDSSVIGSGEAFSGQRYWSSTETSAIFACNFNFSSTSIGIFSNCKTEEFLSVRAVRRVPI